MVFRVLFQKIQQHRQLLNCQARNQLQPLRVLSGILSEEHFRRAIWTFGGIIVTPARVDPVRSRASQK